VQRRLDPARDVIRAEIVTAAALAHGPPGRADAAVVAFERWEEMAAWLPVVRRQLPMVPWLVLADFILAGAFFPTHEPHLCTLARPDAGAEELRDAVEALASGHALRPPAELLPLFLSGAPPAPRGHSLAHPTPAQLRAGCALALGLTDPQIATILHVAPSTVKSHLTALRARLRCKDRHELAALFRQALAPPPPP
jgi:DNA-binding NarL/FixJ family response regulator